MTSGERDARGWQVGLSLQDCLHQLLENQNLADVTFSVTEPSGRSRQFHAHKVILVARSPVFEAMFSGNFREGKDEPVEIVDTEIDAFSMMLRYIYSEKVELSGESVVQVLQLARKYILDGLLAECNTFLKDKVVPDNVCSVLSHSITYGENKIARSCLIIMWLKMSNALSNPNFLEVSHAGLMKFLSSEVWEYMVGLPGQVNIVDEYILVEAALKWAVKQSEIRGISARECIGECLYHLRFAGLTVAQFAASVCRLDVLTIDEQNKWLRFLALPGEDEMKNELTDMKFDVSTRGAALSRGTKQKCAANQAEIVTLSVSKDITLVSFDVFSGDVGQKSQFSFTIFDQTNSKTVATHNEEYSPVGGSVKSLRLSEPLLLKAGITYTVTANVTNCSYSCWPTNASKPAKYNVNGTEIEIFQQQWAVKLFHDVSYIVSIIAAMVLK